jgi:hypothetical protein
MELDIKERFLAGGRKKFRDDFACRVICRRQHSCAPKDIFLVLARDLDLFGRFRGLLWIKLLQPRRHRFSEKDVFVSRG